MRISSICLLNLLLSSPQLSAGAKLLRAGHTHKERNLKEEAKIVQVGDDIGDEAYYSYSGTSVAMSSDGAFLAVGATGSYGYSGHVVIYSFDNSTQSWIQRGQNIKGERGMDESGSSISFSNDGHRIAIGAPYNSGYYGHTRVYEYSADTFTWAQLGDDLDGDREGGHSGSSVALSGNGKRLVIGAPRDSTYSGHAKMYELVDGVWTQLGHTLSGDERTSLGNTVAMSDTGHRIVIGAHYDFLNNDLFVGSVEVFEYIDDIEDWIQVGSELKGEEYFDLFGHSVDISSDGKRIVIGVPNEDIGSLHNVGKAEVYEYNADLGDWQLYGSAILGDQLGEQLGQTVSINGDGNRIVVGSGFCDEGGNNAGCTWVYDYDDTSKTWLQIGDTIYGEFAGDRSGKALAISADGAYFAVGSPHNEYFKGHTRVYEITRDEYESSPAPTQESSITPSSFQPSSSPFETFSSVPSLSPTSKSSTTPSLRPSSSPFETFSSVPSLSPTSKSSTTPSLMPSSSPSNNNPCNDASLRLLSIEITTDANGEKDNKFVVKKYNTAAGKFRGRVFGRNKLPSSKTMTYEKCLPFDACYSFTLHDKSEDGICCEHGAGSFKVTWDGELIKKGFFKNGKNIRSPRFGDTCVKHGL